MDKVHVLIERRGNGIRVMCPEDLEMASKTMSVKAYFDRRLVDWDAVDEKIDFLGKHLGFPAAFAKCLGELESLLMPERLLPSLTEMAKNRHVQFVLDDGLGGIPWHLFTIGDIRAFAESAAPGGETGQPYAASILLEEKREDDFLDPAEMTGDRPVAFVAGSPQDGRLTSVAPECEAVRRELEAAGYRVIVRSACTRAQFWEAVGDAQVLHFAGHSRGREGKSEAYIQLEDGKLTESEIMEKFRSQIRCIPSFVMLNSCNSAAYGAGRKVAGLPEVFRRLGMKYYVANRWKMPDVSEAVIFSRTFYHQALKSRCIIAEALAVASQNLPALHKAAPILFGDGTRTMQQVIEECPRKKAQPGTGTAGLVWESGRGGCAVFRSGQRLHLRYPADWSRQRVVENAASGMVLAPVVESEEMDAVRRIVLSDEAPPWESILGLSGDGPARSRVLWQLLEELAQGLDSLPPADAEAIIAILKDLSPANLFFRIQDGGRVEVGLLADPVVPAEELHRVFDLKGMANRDVPPIMIFFWRLGLIVYKAWTGKYPFSGESPLGLAVPDQLPLRIKLELPGQNAPAKRDYLEDKLLAVVERLMSRSWDRRYESLSAFAADLTLDFGAPEIPGPILQEFDKFINTGRISMAIGYAEYADEIRSLITYAESRGWLIVDIRLEARVAERMENDPDGLSPERAAVQEARSLLRYYLDPKRDYAELVETEGRAPAGSARERAENHKVLLVLDGFLEYMDEYASDLVTRRIQDLEENRGGPMRKFLWLDYAPLSFSKTLEPLVKAVTIPFPDHHILYSFLRRRLPQLWPSMRFSSIIGTVVAASSGLSLSTLGSVLNEIGFRTGSADMDLNDLAHEIYAIKQRILNEGEVRTESKRFSEIRGFEVLTAWLVDKFVGVMKGESASLLLVGLTGGGKTQFIRSFAEEAGLTMVSVTPTSILGGLVGESEANLRRKLNLARMLSPAILLVDDVGGFFKGHHTHEVQSSLLSMLNHFIAEKPSGVITVLIQTLEPAAGRSGLDDVPGEFLADGKLDAVFFAGRLSPGEMWRYCGEYFASWGRGAWDEPEDRHELMARLERILPSEIEKYANDAMFEAAGAEITPGAFNDFLVSRGRFRPLYSDLQLKGAELLAMRMSWKPAHLSASHYSPITEGKESS